MKDQIKADVGDYLVESIISSAGKVSSPVDGGEWKKTLNKEYKKRKEADGLPGKPNMEFSGDMLDALTYKETSTGIEIGWFGKEAGKADGHNNFSGNSNLPRRQTLPDVGEKFISNIQNNIEQIVADAVSNNTQFDMSDFNSVNSKAELYSVLEDYFPGAGSRADIRSIVTRTPSLVALLDDLDVLDFL